MPAKVLDRESVLLAIAEQKLGFEFGKPQRVTDQGLAVVLPILRRTIIPRTYTTFPEVGDKVEVKDSGAIDIMKATNTGDLAVFLRSGTIFKGQTQTRTSQRSVVILPGSTVDVKVRCIYASHGIRSGSKVQYGSVSPLRFEQSVYDSGFRSKGQPDYWSSANIMNAFMCSSMGMSNGRPNVDVPSHRDIGTGIFRQYGNTTASTPRYWLGSQGLQVGNYENTDTNVNVSVSSGTADWVVTQPPLTSQQPSAGFSHDDLSSTFDAFSSSMDDILSKVSLVDDQVGLALITDTGCQTIEIFDAHSSWSALHTDAVKRVGPSVKADDNDSVFEYRPEKAQEVVRRVLALDFEQNMIYDHKPSNGDPAFSVYGLTSKDKEKKYTGEVVEFDGKMIHLMLLKMVA